MDYSLYIFDLYNTLIYIAEKHRPYRKFFRDNHILSRQTLEIAMTKPHRDFAELANLFDIAQQDFTSYETLLDKELQSVKLYPETIKVLQKLRSKKIAVISNLATPYCQPFFTLGLHKIVDAWIFSCDVGVRKPHPKIYGLLQQKWQIPVEQTLMVGDSLACDVHGPQQVGFDAILLDRKQQSTDAISSLRQLL